MSSIFSQHGVGRQATKIRPKRLKVCHEKIKNTKYEMSPDSNGLTQIHNW